MADGFRLVVAGSRLMTHPDFREIVASFVEGYTKHFATEIAGRSLEIVSGGAQGIDRYGELYAKDRGLPLHEFPANWGAYGLRAGPIRNGQMAAACDGVLVLSVAGSKGSRDMVAHARVWKRPLWWLIWENAEAARRCDSPCTEEFHFPERPECRGYATLHPKLVWEEEHGNDV